MKNIEIFYRSIADEIESRFKRVTDLVSGAALESGRWKESIFRDIISKYLPSKYTVCTGYIKNNITGLSSKQIDIIIYDRVNFSPIIESGDFAVVPADSVFSIIEIKTGVVIKKENEYKDLRVAFENIKSAKNVVNRKIGILENRSMPFSFIIFIKSRLWKDYQEFGESLLKWGTKMKISDQPELILVWNKYIAWKLFYGGKFGMRIGQYNDKIREWSIALLLGQLDCYAKALNGIKPKPDFATYFRMNYLDFEKNEYKIFDSKRIQIGGAIIDN